MKTTRFLFRILLEIRFGKTGFTNSTNSSGKTKKNPRLYLLFIITWIISVTFTLLPILCMGQSDSSQKVFSTIAQEALYSKSTELLPTLKDLHPSKLLSYQQITNPENISINTKSIFANFKLTNNTDDSIVYLGLSGESVPEVYLYEIANGFQCVGGTGFAHMQSTLSVPNDTRSIQLKILPGQTKQLALQVRAYDESIFLPYFEILTEESFFKKKETDKNSNQSPYKAIALFIIGIHLCLAIVGVYWRNNHRFKKPLNVFVVMNFMYVVYYLNYYEFLNFENPLLPNVRNVDYGRFLGCLEPALYYLFFYSYLTFNGKFKYWGIFLKYSGIYWLVYFVFRMQTFSSLVMISITQNLKQFATIYDLIITFFVFLYLLKFKSPFYRYARIGVFVLLISAVQMATPFLSGLLGLHSSPFSISQVSYAIMQFAIISDFLLFLYGVSIDSLTAENEKQSLQKDLLESKLHQQGLLLAERDRISRDMHDNLGSGISAIKLQAEFLKQKLINHPNIENDINDLLVTSEDMSSSIREIMAELQKEKEELSHFAEFSMLQAKKFLQKSNTHLDYLLKTKHYQLVRTLNESFHHA